MKVLTQSSQIRKAIRRLLADPEDERIIVVAFVGVDARSYVPEPNGVWLYCWPKAGGTNPYGVEDLLKAGTSVHFVDRLHAKVFWSRKRGVIVGSANLSNNALGEQGLREYVLQLPPRSLDIPAFARTLPVIRDFDSALKRLHAEHVRFQQRNPQHRVSPEPARRLPAFGDWLRRSSGAADWRLGWYEDDARAPLDAVQLLEEETGSTAHSRFLGVSSRNDLAAGVLTLGCRVRQSKGTVRVSALEWWAPELCIPTKLKSWSDYPYIWFARLRPFP